MSQLAESWAELSDNCILILSKSREFSLYHHSDGSDLQNTHSSLKWVLRALALANKWPVLDSNHSHLCSAEGRGGGLNSQEGLAASGCFVSTYVFMYLLWRNMHNVELHVVCVYGVMILLQAINAKGGRYLEAQVQGSKTQAEEGTLVILAAGDRSLFDDCQSCFKAMGKNSFYLG